MSVLDHFIKQRNTLKRDISSKSMKPTILAPTSLPTINIPKMDTISKQYIFLANDPIIGVSKNFQDVRKKTMMYTIPKNSKHIYIGTGLKNINPETPENINALANILGHEEIHNILAKRHGEKTSRQYDNITTQALIDDKGNIRKSSNEIVGSKTLKDKEERLNTLTGPDADINMVSKDYFSNSMGVITGKDLPIQEHIGASKPLPYFRYVGHSVLEVGKPKGGFWTSSVSPTGRTDWRRFAKQTIPEKIDTTESMTLLPNPDAKIFQIASKKDYRDLLKKYPIDRFAEVTMEYKKPGETLMDVNWPEVAKDYDAINITQDAAERLKFGTPGLSRPNPWESESTVWFNPAFKQISGSTTVDTDDTSNSMVAFKDAPFVTLYHGTSARKAKNIMETGLLPGIATGKQMYSTTPDPTRVYLTPSPSRAYYYATEHKDPAVLKVKISKKEYMESPDAFGNIREGQSILSGRLSPDTIAKTEEILVDTVKPENISIIKNSKRLATKYVEKGEEQTPPLIELPTLVTDTISGDDKIWSIRPFREKFAKIIIPTDTDIQWHAQKTGEIIPAYKGKLEGRDTGWFGAGIYGFDTKEAAQDYLKEYGIRAGHPGYIREFEIEKPFKPSGKFESEKIHRGSKELYNALAYKMPPEERERALDQAKWDLQMGGIRATDKELKTAFKKSKELGTQPINELLKARGYTGIIPSKEFQNTGYGSVAYMDQPGHIPLDVDKQFTPEELEFKRALEQKRHAFGEREMQERMQKPLKDAERILSGPFGKSAEGRVVLQTGKGVYQFVDPQYLTEEEKSKALPIEEHMKREEPETYNVGLALKNFEELPIPDNISNSMAKFYHGTHKGAVTSILRKGIMTSKQLKAEPPYSYTDTIDPKMSHLTDTDKTYVFKKPYHAKSWAKVVSDTTGFPPAIIEVDIPKKELEPDYSIESLSAYSHKGPIPPEKIVREYPIEQAEYPKEKE